MFARLAAKFAVWCLSKARLSYEDRALLTNQILDSLAALPLHDIIYINEEGSLFIRGKAVEMEVAKKLRDSAGVALNSYALNLIRDQVLFEALNMGMIGMTRIEESVFSKAAVWWGQRQEKILVMLAQANRNLPLDED